MVGEVSSEEQKTGRRSEEESSGPKLTSVVKVSNKKLNLKGECHSCTLLGKKSAM